MIECLERNDWDNVKLEPKTELDKVDIQLYKDNQILTAIQVKSSKNAFSKPSVERWLESLKRDSFNAKEIWLILVGDAYTSDCEKFIRQYCNVIKTVTFDNLEVLCAGKLTKYVKRAGVAKDVRVSDLDLIDANLFSKIHRNSILNEPLSRAVFEEAFCMALPTRRIPKCLTSIPMVDQSVGLIGREKELKKVHSMLQKNNMIALVSGLGGIGKTALMKWICNNLKEKDNYVAWIDCGSSLKEDLLSLCDAFGIYDEEPDTAYKKVLSVVKTQLDGSLYLFMDNLGRQPDDKELAELNSLNAHIMVTSRQKNSAFPSVDLNVLGQEDALTMFFKYYNGDTERVYIDSARYIVISAGRHTLLVELLAKAAARTGGTLEDFAKDLAEKDVFDVFKRKLTTAHGRNVNQTIEDCVMKLYEISNLSKEQQRIMKLFSIFTPENEVYWKVAEWAGLDMDVVDELVSLAWLGRGGQENNYKIHQIIKDSLARQLKGSGEVLKIEEYGDLLVKVVDTRSYMPRYLEYTKVRKRLTFAEDIVDYLVERAAEMQASEADIEQEQKLLIITAELCNNIAGVYKHQGDYAKALEYYGKALKIKKSVLGSEDPSMATTYNNIAGVFKKQRDYVKALKYYGKALEIKEKVLDSEDPSLATAYNNIAGVYKNEGDYDRALKYYEKALEIKEKVLDSEDPSLAIAYNNIAGVYKKQRDYVKALGYYRKALEIKESVLNPKDPSMATAYNNIAGVYYNQGDYVKALEHYGTSLEIKESVLGPDHPSMAATYNNIAYVYFHKGDVEKASEYFEKAQSVRKKE